MLFFVLRYCCKLTEIYDVSIQTLKDNTLYSTKSNYQKRFSQ